MKVYFMQTSIFIQYIIIPGESLRQQLHELSAAKSSNSEKDQTIGEHRTGSQKPDKNEVISKHMSRFKDV